MALYRLYLDKKITDDGTGGEHSRVVDLEAEDSEHARDLCELEGDEVIGQVVALSTAEPVVQKRVEIVEALAKELQEKLEISFDEAYSLASGSVARAGVF